MPEVNGHIIDVKTGKVLKNKKIIISNGRIKDVKSSNFDCKQFILPGLIDSHVHIILEPLTSFPVFKANESLEIREKRIFRNLQNSLKIGITTVRDCGYPDNGIFKYQKLINNNPLLGSRLIICGPAITILNGHGKDLGVEFEDLIDLQTIVQKILSQNVDCIKLINNDDPAGISTKQIKAVVKLAHQVNKKVACHIYQKQAIKRAIEAKVDTIEHFGRADQEMIDQIIRNKIIVVPTYASALDAVGNPESNVIESEDIESAMSMSFKQWTKRLKQGTQLLIKNKAILATGTDAGFLGTDFQTVIREMLALAELGASNLEVIQAATINGAKALDRVNDFGSIEIGKYADLVVYNQNPLINLDTIKNPQKVYKEGIEIV